MVRPVIFYRGTDFEKSELNSAQKYFYCTNRFPEIKSDDIVISRHYIHSYNEYLKDLKYIGAKSINNYNQHLYVSDLQNYVVDLKELTPKTWKDLSLLPNDKAFVLRGEANSKKSSWEKNMFASSKDNAIKIYNHLIDDSLIGQQQIYIREYVPLFKYMDGVNNMPVTKEYRFFVAYGEIISGGYYWSNYLSELPYTPDASEVPETFLQNIIKKVNGQCNFYSIDVAQTTSGEWIVIDLNEGQFADLCNNDSNYFYSKLYKALKRNAM